jgi:oxygen-dependent protoporphyrinogen oxidase
VITRRVAVIGGGLAGLAAAVRLQGAGARPVVFEADSDVGGVVRTTQEAGWTIDSGAAMAAEPAPSVRDLLDAAGVGECLVRAGPAGTTRFIVLNGAPVVLPRTTAELSSSALLSLGGRLRLLKERFIPARRDDTDESVDAFARRRFGDEMAERMFDPLVASTCAGDARRIVARYAFPGVVGHERGAGSSLQGTSRARMEARRRAKGRPTGSWSCAEGMQQLPRKLASAIGGARTGVPIGGVTAAQGRFEVSPHGGAPEMFDAVIFAVPAPALGTIAIELDGAEQLSRVAAMPYASIVAVSLGFGRDQLAHSLDGSRLLVPTIERRDVLSMVFPSSSFAGRAPADHLLVTAFVGGALRPELVDRSDADLVSLVLGETRALLGASGVPVISRVTRWRHALPQAVAGHADRLAAADAVEAATPAIAFAGAWRDGLSIGEVLLGGIGAADRLAARAGWTST